MDPAARPIPVISNTTSIGDNNRDCVNIVGSHNTEFNNCEISVTDEKPLLLEWLSPLQPQERHQAIRVGRVAGVGDWLLHTNQFRQWHESDDGAVSPVLFCYGNPGVGKTYLSSLVVDTLYDRVDMDKTMVACMYCDFQNEQSAEGLLGALLKQAVGAFERIPEEIQGMFRSSKGRAGSRRLLLPDILGMLIKYLPRFRLGFICIDALDEFPAKERPELWESLQTIAEKCPNTRLFLTGRLQILDEVQKYFPRTAEMLPISPGEHDIRLYLRVRLSRDLESSAMDKELEADILRTILYASKEIFLLVSLNTDAVLAGATIHERRRALQKITNGLGLQDAYNTTLDRIRQQGGGRSRIGMEALMWISHSRRPLKLVELCHALGVELGAEDFNINNVPSAPTLLGSTLGLVTIDETTSTVRLLHLTLREYLGSSATPFVTAHSIMAEVCLTYLNSQLVRALPVGLDTSLAASPFLEYAACFWGFHAAQGVTEPVKFLALRLLDGYENHVSAAIFCRNMIPNWPRDNKGISGLHYIVILGISEIEIAMLKEKRRDVNSRDWGGNTPLMWALGCRKTRMVKLLLKQEDIEPDVVIRDGRTVFSFAAGSGNEDVVKLLLRHKDVNPNSSDNNGRIPLSHATSGGHEGVVKLLLGRRDINPNSSDNNGRTLLSHVASGGHEGIVKLLLERRDANPNSSDNNGRTPLSLAVSRRHEGVVKLLLECLDVKPNSPDKYGHIPLLSAVSGGDRGIVKLLLEYGDVDPNLPDKHGRTLLSLVAGQGEEDLVKIFLERSDVNPNSLDINDRTPLSSAASGGYEGAVRLLLERRDVKPNSPDKDGRTPLSLAASRGYEGVVNLLLECRDIDPDLVDRNDRTPLSFAASGGHKGIVKLLVQRQDVNPNSLDDNGRSPLSFAAEHRHQRVVRLLLENEDIDPNSADKSGRTPLALAVSRGHECIARLLLERRDINPNSLDNCGRTPISSTSGEWEQEDIAKLLLERQDVNPDLSDKHGRTLLSLAVSRGHRGVVKLLLQRSDVNPNSLDNNGRTPLLFAASAGDEVIAELLLESGGLNPNLGDHSGRTPLSHAVSRGHEGVVKLLLQRGDVDPDSSDNHGLTPLSFGASGGSEGVVKLLLGHRRVDPNHPDDRGRTPLSHAVSRGHEGAVKLLLQRGDVNPNPPDNNGQTPLSYAIFGGNEGIVRLLLERGGVNPNSSDANGRTPLSIAASRGHEGLVKLLLDRGDVNPDSSDSDCRTPLSHAAGGGERLTDLFSEHGGVETGRSLAALGAHEGVVKRLLERGDVNPNSSDKNGRTPLSLASSRGYESVVKMLLECKNVDPNLSDNNGRTPLSFAAEYRYQHIVKLLLEHSDVNPDLPDNNGRTPLSYAAEFQYPSVSKLLSRYLDLDRGPPETSCRITGRLRRVDTAEQEIMDPLPALDVTPQTIDSLPLVASLTRSASPRPLKQAPPLERSALVEPDSPPAPSISTPAHPSSAGFPFFLLSLTLLFSLIFLVLLTHPGYQDTFKLFQTIRRAWD